MFGITVSDIQVKLRRLLRYMMLKDKTASLKSSQDDEEANETGNYSDTDIDWLMP